MQKALIFRGGWDGHEPVQVSELFGKLLEQNGFIVEIFDSQDCLADREKLLEYDLIIPCWTMGSISREYRENVCAAVESGVGLAGCHGGMCDAFREDTEWQYMTGGQWVAHPGGDGVNYIVNVRKCSSPIVEGLEDFLVSSEQYYMHVDPVVNVLATTRFPVVDGPNSANGPVDMPVAWTKFWGLGRVFYCSLGHHDDVFDAVPAAELMMERGMLWAAEGKHVAGQRSLNAEKL